MKRARFSEDQIIAVLREQEAPMKVAELCGKRGISEPTLYAWKAKFDGISMSNGSLLRDQMNVEPFAEPPSKCR